MVLRYQQYMLLLLHPHQLRTDQRPSLQIKGHLHFRQHQFFQLRFSISDSPQIMLPQQHPPLHRQQLDPRLTLLPYKHTA